jgi:hypothetical protein
MTVAHTRLPTRVIIFLVWQCRYMKGTFGCEHKSSGFTPLLEAKLEQGRMTTVKGREFPLGFDFIFQLHRSGLIEYCHNWGPTPRTWPADDQEAYKEVHAVFRKYNLEELSRKCNFEKFVMSSPRQRRFRIPGVESAIISLMGNEDGLTILQ